MILVKTRLPPLEKEPFLDFKAFQSASYSLLLAGQFIIYLGLFFPYFVRCRCALSSLSTVLTLPSMNAVCALARSAERHAG